MWGTSVLALAVCLFLERILRGVIRWWRLRKLEVDLRSQDLKGPVPSFMAGTALEEFSLYGAAMSRGMDRVSHDIFSHVTPDVAAWSIEHGKPYLTRWFSEPRLTIFDPESVRDILSKQFDKFEKSQVQLDFVIAFIGSGLVGLNGKEWSHHRTVLSSAFRVEKLKMMHSAVKRCSTNLVEDWKRRVGLNHGPETEVEVQQDLKKLAAGAISHAAFGSNYENGERVFQGLTQLGPLLVKMLHNAWLPFYQYLPTKVNFHVWKLRREIDSTLLSLIRNRRRSPEAGHRYGNDLLGLVLEEGKLDERALVNECKAFYFAGHETTAALLSWVLFLLALHPEWQEKARAEAQQHCSSGDDDAETLSKLKVLGMIIYETMRLYPPAWVMQRASSCDTVLSNGLRIPRGTGIVLPILALHHDPELWGPDVNEFKPERFANGLSQAGKHPNAFMGFGFGPRVCIGQAFALMEAKIVVATLLQHFSFKLSAKYRHNPVAEMSLHANNGLQLLIQEI